MKYEANLSEEIEIDIQHDLLEKINIISKKMNLSGAVHKLYYRSVF